jgi:biotin/methionine sulfoxide reductase
MTLTHWGAFRAHAEDDQVVDVEPLTHDPDPSPIGRSLEAVTRSRVMRPAVRRSWMEGGPGTATHLRGAEPFVEVDWDTAIALVAAELDRVRTTHGNQAIYGGSYGWSSPGRFHHAQSQIHRFLAAIGGYTRSVNTYSLAAAEVIVPHVLGHSWDDVQDMHTSWPVIAEETDVFVAFGGVPWKNSQVQYGGQGTHTLRKWMVAARRRGCRFVNVGPIRDDVLAGLDARWFRVRPNTDVALMLALMRRLVTSGRADEEFLATHCHGWERLAGYLAGEGDGIEKSPRWAAEITGVEVDDIEWLADLLGSGTTMVNSAWALQRAHHGEQAYWATIALAAVVGHIGVPGGGFGLGYGATGAIGKGTPTQILPRLGSRPNAVSDFIPVARIADCLLSPGTEFSYDGGTYRYPQLRLIYWSGGNPFHHHQDLRRLERAWQVPETIVVHEPYWTATARRADVVLPITTALEREDIGGAPIDDHLVAMQPVISPVGEARDDFDVFAALAHRLGAEPHFSEGRSSGEWVRAFYERFAEHRPDAPDYEAFVAAGYLQKVARPGDRSHLRVLFDAFRADPIGSPLPTPSGRIELYSDTIATFELEDCPPHPAWLEPRERLGMPNEFPLHLVSNQPRSRLHSQLDHGVTSAESKRSGREPVRIHPHDAAARGIRSGDVVRLFNVRGSCLAGAVVDDGVMEGVVQLSTGAWWAPTDEIDCVHGNPNVLTTDAGSSSLAQGPSAHTCMVDVERFAGTVPDMDPHAPPMLIRTGSEGDARPSRSGST